MLQVAKAKDPGRLSHGCNPAALPPQERFRLVSRPHVLNYRSLTMVAYKLSVIVKKVFLLSFSGSLN